MIGVREEAAKHNFENFHNATVAIIRKALFSDITVPDEDGVDKKYNGRYFPEVRFLVNEVDVKEVTPVNAEIYKLLNQSIKSNMIIVCKKMESAAEIDAAMQKVKAKAAISTLREKLVDIENANLRLEKLEKAKSKIV